MKKDQLKTRSILKKLSISVALAILPNFATPTLIFAQNSEADAQFLLPVQRDIDTEQARWGKHDLTKKFINQPALFYKKDLLLNLFWVWEPELRKEALQSSPKKRLELIFKRYGYVKPPYNNYDLPMGMTYNPLSRDIAPNCLACHGGSINGKTILGLGNARQDAATFFEDLEVIKSLLKGKPPVKRPNPTSDRYGNMAGAFNAWQLSADLLKVRDLDLEKLDVPLDLGEQVQTDMDPPPWWNVKFKKNLYMDGAFEHSPRFLMQFAMDNNTGEQIRNLETTFNWISAYIDSIPPPKYPFSVSLDQATLGKEIFKTNCSGCHGTYSTTKGESSYPERYIPANVVGTDPVRASPLGLPIEFRKYFQQSWFGFYGAAKIKEEMGVYVAPPLTGIWASAPYFHNGSVPTLRHVFYPQTRPTVWKIRAEKDFDIGKTGLLVDEFDEVPKTEIYFSARRKYVDTRVRGRSNQGHLFGSNLSDDEKNKLLEYLKTL